MVKRTPISGGERDRGDTRPGRPSSIPHPGFIEPCLPTLARAVPDGPQRAFEIKHDGYRFIARRDGYQVRVFSRYGKDWSDKVPLMRSL